MYISRRSVLAAGLAGIAVAPLAGTAWASPGGKHRMVFVFLRGGLDGLSAVPAYGDPDYGPARGGLAVPPPGGEGGALRLDDLFGLHPALPTWHSLYQAGEMAVVHAAASPYRKRSHFDAQTVVEAGGTRADAASQGWINRALAASKTGGISLTSSVPLIMRGEHPVTSWSPSVQPKPDDNTLLRLEALYHGDRDLAQSFERARSMNSGETKADGARFEDLMHQAGVFLAEPDGPRVAYLELGGWDTHARQGAPGSPLVRNLRALDTGIGSLKRSLGHLWTNTTVVVFTEFGRTVAMNGSGGTDHGTGGAVLLAGGGVQGGRVTADWPGLSSNALREGRDLRPTTDLRAVFKGAIADPLGSSRPALGDTVFPDSGEVQPTPDLVRS